MKNIILGILGIGGLAGIAYLVTSFFGKKSDIGEAIHKITQKIKQKKIKDIEEKQVVIVKKIEDNEKLSEDIKKEIVDIKKEANVKIKEILKKDNFGDLVNEVDDLW